jgi:hypothetical protein
MFANVSGVVTGKITQFQPKSLKYKLRYISMIFTEMIFCFYIYVIYFFYKIIYNSPLRVKKLYSFFYI